MFLKATLKDLDEATETAGDSDPFLDRQNP